MTDPSVLEKQSQALIAFANSIGRPIRKLAWPYSATMPEPVEYSLWQLYATTVERFSMFYDAGLVAADEQAFYDRLFTETAELERSAWVAWQRQKERLEMDLITGRRKSLPWKC